MPSSKLKRQSLPVCAAVLVMLMACRSTLVPPSESLESQPSRLLRQVQGDLQVPRGPEGECHALGEEKPLPEWIRGLLSATERDIVDASEKANGSYMEMFIQTPLEQRLTVWVRIKDGRCVGYSVGVLVH
jgi:hypothetical protein